jgi:hypothetical protein
LVVEESLPPILAAKPAGNGHDGEVPETILASAE